MSFHASAEDIELIDGHILKCRVATVDGDWQTSQIDLDQFIGNIDGTSHLLPLFLLPAFLVDYSLSHTYIYHILKETPGDEQAGLHGMAPNTPALAKTSTSTSVITVSPGWWGP